MNEIKTFISFQGNISSSKTTLLSALKETLCQQNLLVEQHLSPSTEEDHGGSGWATPELPRDLYLILDEPVSEWEIPNCSKLNYFGEGEDSELRSMLHLFYEGQKPTNPEDVTNPVALPFQVFAFTTRLEYMVKRLSTLPKFDTNKTHVHIISERSLRTDRLFFKNLYESGKVKQYEWAIYERFFQIICGHVLKKEDAMIYMTTSPEKSHERHIKRNREAETKNDIPLEYFQSLEKYHREMIEVFEKEKGSERVIHMDFEAEMTKEEIDCLVPNLMERIKALH